jgi:quinoprotein glucose dehydrogenase
MKSFRSALVAATALSLSACASALPVVAAPVGDWPTFGHDAGGSRHSRLGQITPDNVGQLRQAWVYNMRPPGEAAASTAMDRQQSQAEGAPPPGAPAAQGGPFARSANGFAPSESVPLVVGGVMYLATPYGRVVALDAGSGRELWAYALPNREQVATRGVEYWPGDANTGPRIVFGTRSGRLIAIEAATGLPSPDFGEDGSVDLKTPDVMVTGTDRVYGMNSPPVIYKDLVITGSNTGEGLGGPVGDVRAWDVRTGRRVWTFHSRPRPGEPGSETWGGDSGVNRSGVNVWGLMTVDAERGIVYMPFGAPANDRIGVDRPGSNLYSSSIVAADAATGRYLWHFQLVHHDIWDIDTAAPPTLLDVRHEGLTIPAVALISKSSLLFIVDRTTGRPIYGVEERPVPPSDVPGEQASPTQPFPLKPEPLSRNTLTMAGLAKITPELEDYCRRLVEENNMLLGGPYLPTALNRYTVNMPGTIGGVNWAGGAYDPQLGYYVVNVFDLGQIQRIVPDPSSPIGFANRGELNGRFWNGQTRQPCTAPPWGQLVAVNVNTGDIAWRSNLGVTDTLPEGRQDTGRPSLGGPITTASGLTFIAATDDSRFRAFDTRTGKEVWTVRLPGSAHTNPVTFADRAGRQHVAIVATGGAGFLGTPVVGDSLITYSLP